MPNPAHQTANRQTVRSYLKAAYIVEDTQLDDVLAHDATAREDIEDATAFAAMAYFAGDKIAERYGWPEDSDYDIDAEDEDEDDD